MSSAAYPTILRSEKFITVLVGNSGKVLRDEIRISCEKKSSDQVFFFLFARNGQLRRFRQKLLKTWRN